MVYWKDVIPLSEGLAHPAQTAPAGASAHKALASIFDEEATESRAEATKPAGRDKDEMQLDDDDDDIDFVDDDDGGGYADPIEGLGELRRYHEKSRARVLSRLGADAPLNTEIGGGYDGDIQDPFQPGATPMKNGRRYLAFNMIGVIYTIDAHTHSNVNVEFHDRSQRPFHFTDHYNYTMASLGVTGALFACEANGGNASTLFYRPFDSWATKSDWTVQFGASENIKAITLTAKGPVVATDQLYLRFFSVSGIQTSVVCLPGPVVSLATHANMLFVVHHAGGAYHGNQNMAYILYDMERQRIVHKDRLPISMGSTLSWVGVSEIGMPVSYDASGVLRVLLPYGDFQWVPILDTRMAKVQDQSVEHWPVGVTDRELMCIVCKGVDKHPHFPKPLITELPLTVPFIQLDTPTAQLEEKFYKGSIVAAHLRASAETEGTADSKEQELLKRDVEMDKVLIQLILTACKTERVQRALDLCNCLHTTKSIDGAIKIAVHHHLPGLAERMSLVKEAKLKKQREEEESMLGSQSLLYSHARNWTPGQTSALNGRSGPIGGMAYAAPDVYDDAPFVAAPPVSRTVDHSQLAETPPRPARRSDEVDHTPDGPTPEKERKLFTRTPVAARTETGEDVAAKPKARNPFAISDPEKRHAPVVGGGKTLFEAISQVASAKKGEDAKSKSDIGEATKKRKSQNQQTTLFGMGGKEKDADGAPAEKKAKKGGKKLDADRERETNGNVVTGSSSSAPAKSSIAGFLGIKHKEQEKIQKSDSPVDASQVEGGESIGEVGGASLDDSAEAEPMDVEGAGVDVPNSPLGDSQIDQEGAEVPLKRDKGKGPAHDGDKGSRLDKFKYQK
ncbi:hypothetical protein HDV00_004918 [Rhizophlyctis rosea]|nr:hypothetical protein HDV00_004918 [Rhizophlyctis rosea]